jgi:uncharacterized protein (TIGR00255 family)
MVMSMTGYGRGEACDETKSFTVEIRSVNHRFCEVVTRMPKSYAALEDRVRKAIQEQISRGRLDVFITVGKFDSGKNKSVTVDKDLALVYYNALRDLAEATGAAADIGVTELARMPDVLVLEEKQEDLEAVWSVMLAAVRQATESLVTMRQEEGRRLAQDILHRIDKIEQFNNDIAVRAPLVVEDYRERLRQRVQELLGDVEIDEARLASEVAFFADRGNITEEIVRLRSHFKQVRETVKVPEPVGRKLDFLVQELNREVNTIGSKANDSQIANLVIAAKSEIEKIREQVQNIE